MQIVPVIDIRGGVVVRAVAGERANYRPLVSRLAATPAPLAVAQALLSLHPFDALYIADLDAIEGRGGNQEAIVAIAKRFPHGRIWVDFGARSAGETKKALGQTNVDVVTGSESLETAHEVEGLERKRAILSLDFRKRTFLGPGSLVNSPHLWPQRVIAMTLARVGTNTGPDFAQLAHIRATAPDHSVFAAGGVRHIDDLRRLAEMGAAGALVASALHSGAITSADLASLKSQ